MATAVPRPHLVAIDPTKNTPINAANLGQAVDFFIEDAFQEAIYHWDDLPAPEFPASPNRELTGWFVNPAAVAPGTLTLQIGVEYLDPETRVPQMTITDPLYIRVVDPSQTPNGTELGEVVEAINDLGTTVGDKIENISETIGDGISLRPSVNEPTDDQALWRAIREGSRALSFNSYKPYMDSLLCNTPDSAMPAEFQCLRGRRFLPFNDTDAYRCLKIATEAFLQSKATTWNDTNNKELDESLDDYLVTRPPGDCPTIPYLAFVAEKFKESGIRGSTDLLGKNCTECFSRACEAVLREKLCQSLLTELIWSYWHEEGMLVQTMNAISRRFQNMSRPNLPDPLANLEIDPLRPLNNLLWGYLQDEQHRLSLVRRAYEYEHHYGLKLQGKAVPDLRPADSRSKFLSAFHTLLELTSTFYQRDDDTTVNADAFPVLNALKEVHLILSQGAHNQFGDLPSTARQEMMIQQWLLSRAEFREFLPTRAMVRYPEPWMDRVDAMKSLQGWSDTSIIHYNKLAVFGEQIVLSIRFGDWNDVNAARDQAKNWARDWREEIQGYIHSYRAVTSVDVSASTVGARGLAERDMLPSFHIRRQMRRQQALPAASRTAGPGVFSQNGSKPGTQQVPEPALRRS